MYRETHELRGPIKAESVDGEKQNQAGKSSKNHALKEEEFLHISAFPLGKKQPKRRTKNP